MQLLNSSCADFASESEAKKAFSSSLATDSFRSPKNVTRFIKKTPELRLLRNYLFSSQAKLQLSEQSVTLLNKWRNQPVNTASENGNSRGKRSQKPPLTEKDVESKLQVEGLTRFRLRKYQSKHKFVPGENVVDFLPNSAVAIDPPGEESLQK